MGFYPRVLLGVSGTTYVVRSSRCMMNYYRYASISRFLLLTSGRTPRARVYYR